MPPPHAEAEAEAASVRRTWGNVRRPSEDSRVSWGGRRRGKVPPDRFPVKKQETRLNVVLKKISVVSNAFKMNSYNAINLHLSHLR